MSTPKPHPLVAPTRVLMIEDDQRLSSMVAEYLARSGMTVVTKADAASGLEAAADETFDAVILDLMLPDGDGLDVCRSLRAGSGVPVLMLTARGDEMDRIVGLEIGADDYLPKPFNPRELLARLRAILRRAGRAGATQASTPDERLQFGRLIIDCGQRHVSVDGEERTITAHQFDLLRALAENAGRVMSRDSLMNAVRGESLEAFDRSIDVHISRIRAAIEDDPKRPRRVITVRGAGYVFARRQDQDADL
ncbi:MAG: response regulator [Gammaproteobacteria bacterium]